MLAYGPVETRTPINSVQKSRVPDYHYKPVGRISLGATLPNHYVHEPKRLLRIALRFIPWQGIVLLLYYNRISVFDY